MHMDNDFPTFGDRTPADDAYVRENLLVTYDLVAPLEAIERLLHAGDVDAAAKALSEFIRPNHRAPLTWSPKREAENAAEAEGLA